MKATAISDPSRHLASMDIGNSTPPATVNVVGPPVERSQSHHSHSRCLTSSNSFDSKSSLPVHHGGGGGSAAAAAAGFYMSAEASKLFYTLQQSPLPLVAADVIN